MSFLSYHRDTDYLITEKLDDKDLLNLCHAIPNLSFYKSNDFWRRRFASQGFIRNSPDIDWFTVFLHSLYVTNLVDSLEQQLKLAAFKGFDILVEFLVEKGFDNWDGGMAAAIEGGHRHLVDYFIDKGAEHWDLAMTKAARAGNYNLINFFIDKGADDWNSAMGAAIDGNHLNLVFFFIERGADNWNYGMMTAALNDNISLVTLFVRFGADNWKAGLKASKGNPILVVFFQQKLSGSS